MLISSAVARRGTFSGNRLLDKEVFSSFFRPRDDTCFSKNVSGEDVFVVWSLRRIADFLESLTKRILFSSAVTRRGASS